MAHATAHSGTRGVGAVAVEDAVRGALEADRAALLARIRRWGSGLVEPEEILQTATARALEKASTLADPARAAAWLGRIARNATMDALRRRGLQTVALEDVDPPAPADDSQSACACVLTEAQRLKPAYAEILHRVVVEGAPVTAVASELGVTPNNAMVRLHRARKALEARILAHCGSAAAALCSDCHCSETERCAR
jgi:DNA-directed RNA polymerase specialized sigma24 family protein